MNRLKACVTFRRVEKFSLLMVFTKKDQDVMVARVIKVSAEPIQTFFLSSKIIVIDTFAPCVNGNGDNYKFY